jgi:chromosome segregation ATPase
MEMPKELQGLVEAATKKLQLTDGQRLEQLQAARQIGDVRVATYKQTIEMISKELKNAQTQVKCIDYEIQILHTKLEAAKKEPTAAEHGPMPEGSVATRDTVPMDSEGDGPLKED